MGVGIRQSVADVDNGFLTQPELASQSASTLEKLLGNRFCHYGKHGRKKNGKNSTERYGIPNFRRFWKSLATSSVNVNDRRLCKGV